ncbi:MAG: ABC transporter permease, partial [Nitrospirae bacterium]|nr:ABC transporter permease [Nitrospirota bacterium]
MKTLLKKLGSWFLALLKRTGHMFIFLLNSICFIFRPPFKFKILLRQIYFFGNKSLVVILLTGSFTGMVLALQLHHILRKFGSEALLGPGIA